ncbi:MAG: sulfite exporter TauE/SafE family protein [Rhodospirillaceae bacterium]|nr:sulfite exporter TauE/SafE family protein [Rhodospirillaceae bacterium]
MLEFFGFPDARTAIIVMIGFFVAGLAKGAFGLGMPFFGMPIMTFAISFQSALGMFAVPNFTANFQQMLMGGRIVYFFRRFAWLLATTLVTVPFSVQYMVTIDQATCLLVFGSLAFLFAGVQMFPVSFTVSPAQERWMNPIVGLLCGALAGLSGLYGPILIVYFMALRLSKEDFVAAISLMYFMGSLAIYGALAYAHVLTFELLAASAVGAVIIGLMVHFGQFVRQHINEARYRKLILLLLMAIGIEMILRSQSIG